MEQFYNKHYIKVDSSNRIVEGWSDGPHRDKDTTDAICINDKGGYQFRLLYLVYDPSYELLYHHHESVENPPLFDFKDMIPLYKYEGGYVRLRTEEELETDRAARPAPPPTTNERISILEEQLAQSDETAIALYEAQEAQEVINAQQDEALMEIYEMIG